MYSVHTIKYVEYKEEDCIYFGLVVQYIPQPLCVERSLALTALSQ